VWLRLSVALFLSLCAAVAIHLSYGAGFVDDLVAYPTTAYVCALTAFSARYDDVKFIQRGMVRLLLGGLLGPLVLVQLRSWALLEVPVGQYVTTGHSPYLVLPTATLVVVLLLELLARWLPRVAVKEETSPGADASES
jgi:hypothetical protein